MLTASTARAPDTSDIENSLTASDFRSWRRRCYHRPCQCLCSDQRLMLLDCSGGPTPTVQ